MHKKLLTLKVGFDMINMLGALRGWALSFCSFLYDFALTVSAQKWKKVENER